MTNIESLKAALLEKQNELEAAAHSRNCFELDESDYEESYKEFIDECTGTVEIMGMSFTASRILEELDPIAFACGLSDYVDGIDKEDNSEYQALQSAVEDLESEIEDLEMDIDALENEAE